MAVLTTSFRGDTTSSANASRFYQPELDVLRFLAFLAVLLHHGPTAPGAINIAVRLGGFGLSMFFLLSAYLITQLLLREREQTGNISIRSFYVRRALRIWPLYFTALTVGMAGSWLAPDRFMIDRTAIAALSTFVANWFWWAKFGLLGPLWSISIEEQFYAVWPMVVKVWGRAGVLAASTAFLVCGTLWLGVFSGRAWHLWLDTPVEFMFFAAGALIAIYTRNGAKALSLAGRTALFGAGLTGLFISAGTGVGTAGVGALGIAELQLGYGCAVVGCALIFIAALGITGVPRTLVYLGKISYGLYVFHFGMIELAKWMVKPLVREGNAALYAIAVDSVALVLCVAIARISYDHFESPFLRLKKRFEVIQSRPV